MGENNTQWYHRMHMLVITSTNKKWSNVYIHSKFKIRRTLISDNDQYKIAM